MSGLRIGVDVRHPEPIFRRGTGRYTLQQLQATIAQTPEHHYVLFCLREMPEVLAPFGAYPNVTLYRRFEAYPLRETTRLPIVRRALSHQLARHIREQRLDVFHVPLPFSYTHPFPDRLPVQTVVTVYDLIPLLYPGMLRIPPHIEREYERGLGFIRHTDFAIAISRATQADLTRLLGYPAERIAIAYPAIDPHFTRLEASETRQRLQALGMDGGYILTVTDYFHSKNLDTLLRAYALMGDAPPLVVTFDIQPLDRARFQALADELGIGARVRFTGRVSEDALVALYNGARMVVYPSRYEGFGYPIGEAMACGVPVVTTTASSMPEVAGDAALLVDAEDASAMARAMVRLMTDDGLCADLVDKGRVQVRQFNLSALAQATAEAYQQAAGTADLRPAVPGAVSDALVMRAFGGYLRGKRWADRAVWRGYYLVRPLYRRLKGAVRGRQ